MPLLKSLKRYMVCLAALPLRRLLMCVTELYTGGRTDPFDPLVSPLTAMVDSRHAPTHITIAACDQLKVQDLAYAQHLRSSGVTISEEILPGVPHGFTFPLDAQVTKDWLERQVSVLAAALEAKSS